MLSRLATYTLLGIEARPVEVEVDISPGALPKIILVGPAEAAVKESTHRNSLCCVFTTTRSKQRLGCTRR